MTIDEYEELSAAFTEKNVELLKAMDAGDVALTTTLQAEFATLRIQLDAAHRSVNGLDNPVADPTLALAVDVAASNEADS